MRSLFTGAPTGEGQMLLLPSSGKADAARLVAIVEAELARQDGGGGDSGAGAQVK